MGPFSASDLYNIPAQRRTLYFKVIDGYSKLHLIAQRLHFLEDHFPPDKIDTALKWLVSNRLVHAKFVEWFKIECHNSDLEMHRKLLQVVDNAPLGKVIAGRNFKT